MITFSIVNAKKPTVVSKTFRLINGQVKKDTAADIYSGRVDVAEVDSLEGFASVLASLSPAQCLVYGTAHAASLELVTENAWMRAGRPDHQVARTKIAFNWPDGAGVLMLDYDPAKSDASPLTRDQLITAVRDACPGLRDTAMLWWASASSNIVNTETGAIVNGIRGQRLYIMAADARDIPRAGKTLCERLWASGYGHFEVSKSGSLLERALFDTSVWQSNRIDFAGGAKCHAPLEQQRGSPIVVAGAVQITNTLLAIPELDSATAEAAQEAKAGQRSSKEAEAEIAQNGWKAARIDTMVAQVVKAAGVTVEQARVRVEHQVARVLDRAELFADWQITVKSPGGEAVTVAISEILDDPFKWNNSLTKDPIEPDYDGGRWIGKLYLIGARPRLYSMAHGGKTFHLLRQLERIEIVRGKIADTVNRLIEVLRRSPGVFDYGTEMATPAGGGKLLRLDKDNLRYIAAGLTQFWKWVKVPNTDKLVEVLENPPVDVCASVLALRSMRGLKPLDAVISAPLIRPDGGVMTELGYDAKTRLLLDVSEEMYPITENPTVDELRQAFDYLWKPFENFPFCEPVDRAVMLCALITAVQRPVLSTAPAFAFDAPRQGTGKTLLAECCAILATGERPNAWPHIEKNEEETRKRLLTALRSGSRVLLWDNIVGQFDSPALAALLTSDVYTDRVLGASTSEAYPNRLVVLLTGNNFTPSGELPRRVLTCRLDAQSERPYTRDFTFNPADVCMEQRQGLIAAALTLLRGFISAGSPKVSSAAVGSFSAWDASVRQAVLWIGQNVVPAAILGDPLDSILSRAESDPVDDALSALMVSWRTIFGDKLVTARELVDVHRRTASWASDAELCLADALEELSHGGNPTAKGLGKMLSFKRDRIVGGLQIVRGTAKRDGVLCWTVREMSV